MFKNVKSRKQKIIRTTSACLLFVLCIMLIAGLIFIDSSQSPVLFIYYYCGAMVITLAIFILTGLDLLEIRKTLKNSLEKDEEFLTDLIKTVVKLEKNKEEHQQSPDQNLN